MEQAIERVSNVLRDFGAKFGEGKFVPKMLVEALEPIFAELGYRNPLPAGRQAHILLVRDDAAGDFVLFSPFLRERL